MLVEQILQNYEIKESTGCWEWKSSLSRQGYGQARVNSKMRSMHRFFFEAFNGAVPAGLLVCHQCNNRRCVNPGHLYAGTHLENAADAVAAGTTMRGVRAKHSKLKESDVLLIRKSRDSAKELAEKFHISIWTIFDIRNGRRWNYLLALGLRRRPDKPRIRVTVPAPLPNSAPARKSGEE